jgi:hypothetical protein
VPDSFSVVHGTSDDTQGESDNAGLRDGVEGVPAECGPPKIVVQQGVKFPSQVEEVRMADNLSAFAFCEVSAFAFCVEIWIPLGIVLAGPGILLFFTVTFVLVGRDEPPLFALVWVRVRVNMGRSLVDDRESRLKIVVQNRDTNTDPRSDIMTRKKKKWTDTAQSST